MIEIKGLKKSFKGPSGPKMVLKGFDLYLPDKGLFAIMGASGSGKSTLLNLIAAFMRPDEGSIKIAGTLVHSLKWDRASLYRNQRIGFLFQRYNLIEGFDALYNVTVPALAGGMSNKEAEEKAKSLLRQVGLEGKANQEVSTLSGGEKQRVALARALINDPDLILADEPTGALDSASAESLMAMLKELSEKKLVVLVSHDESLSHKYAEKTFILEEGMIKDGGSGRDNRSAKLKPRRENKAFLKPIESRNRREDIKLHLLSFFVGFAGFSSLMVGLGLYQGALPSLERGRYAYMESPMASISEKQSQEIEGSPLVLTRSLRPKAKTMSRLLGNDRDISYENDYSYFFPPSAILYSGDTYTDPVALTPVYDLTLEEFGSSLLDSGVAPSSNNLEQCLVNEEFSKKWNLGIGDELSFAYSVEFQYEDDELKADFAFDMVISGIVSEFTYLSTPKVFYSYQALKAYFQSVHISDFGVLPARDKTLHQLVEEAAPGDDFSNYGYYVFCHDEDSLETFFELGRTVDKEAAFSWYSFPETSITSLVTLLEGILALMPSFLLIALFSIAFSFMALAYCRYMKREKECAILASLGVKGDSISSIYLKDSVMVGVLSSSLALLAVYFSCDMINGLLYSLTGLPSLVSIPLSSMFGIPYFLFFAMVLLSALLAYLGVSIGTRGIRGKNLMEALREE